MTRKKNSSKNVFNSDKWPLIARNKKQEQYMDAIDENQLVFATGYPGTAKTLIAIYKAFEYYDDRNSPISKIVVIRNLCDTEGSKSIGALPGTLEEKTAPLIKPIYQNMKVFMTDCRIEYIKNKNQIEFIPYEFLRGTTFEDSFIIVEECFPGYTYIKTLEGNKTIKNIVENRLNCLVLSYNEKEKIFEYKKIKNWIKKGSKKISELSFRSKKIEATEDHKFLTIKGWEKLKNLKKGDAIINYSGKTKWLSKQQQSVVIGSILGDGGLHKINDYIFRLKVVNGEKQKDYLYNKSKCFENCKVYKTRAGITNSLKYVFQTKSFYLPFLDWKNRKIWAINNLDDLALTIAWCDDGSLNKNKNHGKLYSCATSLFEAELLSQKLNDKYKMQTKVGVEYNKNKNKDYYSIIFNKQSLNILLPIVYKYYQKNLDYKFDNNNNKNENYDLSENYLGSLSIVKNIKLNFKEEKVYDIEVEDNHNFLVSKTRSKEFIVAHNCQNFTSNQMYSIITRIGDRSKMVCNGDYKTQRDLSKKFGTSGLQDALNKLNKVSSIGVIMFDKPEYIERSGIVKDIILAYHGGKNYSF